MAARTLVQILDDLDGSDATHTIRFSVDGRDYEIDLNDKHEQQFRRAVEKFVQHARRVGARRPKKQKLDPAVRVAEADQRRQIREWAAASGIPCPMKGRIPQAVVDAWNAAP